MDRVQAFGVSGLLVRGFQCFDFVEDGRVPPNEWSAGESSEGKLNAFVGYLWEM